MPIKQDNWVKLLKDYDPVKKGSEGLVTDVDDDNGTVGVTIKRDPDCNPYDYVLGVVEIEDVLVVKRCYQP